MGGMRRRRGKGRKEDIDGEGRDEYSIRYNNSNV
jgi:hypothetical protein